MARENMVGFVKKTAREQVVVLGMVTEGILGRRGSQLQMAMYVAFNDGGEGQMPYGMDNWILGRLEYTLPERSGNPRDYDPLQVRVIGTHDFIGETRDDDQQIQADIDILPGNADIKPVTFIVRAEDRGGFREVDPDNEYFLQLVARIEEAIRYKYRECREQREHQILDTALLRLHALRFRTNGDRHLRSLSFGRDKF